MATWTHSLTTAEAAAIIEKAVREKIGTGFTNFQVKLEATSNGGWTGFVVTFEEVTAKPAIDIARIEEMRRRATQNDGRYPVRWPAPSGKTSLSSIEVIADTPLIPAAVSESGV